MTDHETFALLMAKQLSEPLVAQEEADLAAHLISCPTCRRTATGMRHDDGLLRAELAVAKVGPRVRLRVLDEAAAHRRFGTRLVLGLAAILLLGGIGVPLIVGARLDSTPPPVATPLRALAPSILPVPSSPPPIAISTPSAIEPELSLPPSGPEGFVAGAYEYGEFPPRRDTVAAHFDGGPAGEWSRRIPSTGAGESFGGPVTCLVISGSDAWIAGPATTATDGTDRAALIYVHDGGPDGRDDAAILWLTPIGQTLATVTTWCENQYIPAGPSRLTSGDVVVDDGH